MSTRKSAFAPRSPKAAGSNVRGGAGWNDTSVRGSNTSLRGSDAVQSTFLRGESRSDSRNGLKGEMTAVNPSVNTRRSMVVRPSTNQARTPGVAASNFGVRGKGPDACSGARVQDLTENAVLVTKVLMALEPTLNLDEKQVFLCPRFLDFVKLILWQFDPVCSPLQFTDEAIVVIFNRVFNYPGSLLRAHCKAPTTGGMTESQIAALSWLSTIADFLNSNVADNQPSEFLLTVCGVSATVLKAADVPEVTRRMDAFVKEMEALSAAEADKLDLQCSISENDLDQLFFLLLKLRRFIPDDQDREPVMLKAVGFYQLMIQLMSTELRRKVAEGEATIQKVGTENNRNRILVEQIEKLEKERKIITNDVDSLGPHLKLLDNQLGESVKDTFNYKDLLMKSRDIVRGLEKEAAKCREEAAAREAAAREVDSLRASLAETKDEIRRLEKDTEKWKAEADKLQKELKPMYEELNSIWQDRIVERLLSFDGGRRDGFGFGGGEGDLDDRLRGHHNDVLKILNTASNGPGTSANGNTRNSSSTRLDIGKWFSFDSTFKTIQQRQKQSQPQIRMNAHSINLMGNVAANGWRPEESLSALVQQCNDYLSRTAIKNAGLEVTKLRDLVGKERQIQEDRIIEKQQFLENTRNGAEDTQKNLAKLRKELGDLQQQIQKELLSNRAVFGTKKAEAESVQKRVDSRERQFSALLNEKLLGVENLLSSSRRVALELRRAKEHWHGKGKAALAAAFGDALRDLASNLPQELRVSLEDESGLHDEGLPDDTFWADATKPARDMTSEYESKDEHDHEKGYEEGDVMAEETEVDMMGDMEDVRMNDEEGRVLTTSSGRLIGCDEAMNETFQAGRLCSQRKSVAAHCSSHSHRKADSLGSGDSDSEDELDTFSAVISDFAAHQRVTPQRPRRRPF